MESQRSFLVIGLVMVSFLLWTQWNTDYGPQPVQPAEITESPVSDVAPSVQSADVPEGQQQQIVTQPTQGTGGLVTVTTDTLNLVIDTRGGDVISAKLRQYPVEQGSEESFSLLSPDANTLFVAQSGLIGRDGPDSSQHGRPLYIAEQESYVLTGDTLSVPLTFVTADGLKVTKTFTFAAGDYAIKLNYSIANNGDSAKQFQQYGQLKQTMAVPDEGSMFMPTYRGSAYSTSEDRYDKYSFDDIVDENLREVTQAGWVSMIQHYFVAAWVPPQDETNNIYTRALQSTYATIGYTGTITTLQPGETTELNSDLYLGPKLQDRLKSLAENLDLTVDYGPLWMISQILFDMLVWFHSLVNNWGVAIILITIVVKGAMYWLTKKQYESMAKMRNLAPKMQQLKERHGDDRQKMSQAMMEMYKKEKVNPMGGCFPLLLQMPIFLALYWVLLESVELRHADFAFWITDLSVMDPFLVLPILTGASMWLLQKLQPMTVQDPMQQKIMQWMPVFMSIFFIWFPAGLVLYWLISNVITLIQAKMIYSAMEKKGMKAS